MFEPIGIKDSSIPTASYINWVCCPAIEVRNINNGWNISEGSRPCNCISKLWLVCSYPSLMAVGDSHRGWDHQWIGTPISIVSEPCLTQEATSFLSYHHGLHLVQEAKKIIRKAKRFRDGLSYSTPQKSEKRGNAILWYFQVGNVIGRTL